MASGQSYQAITPASSIQTSRNDDTVLDDVTLNSQRNPILHHPPKSYVLRSFLVLIFCCPIVGFVALLYAFQVDMICDHDPQKVKWLHFAREINIEIVYRYKNEAIYTFNTSYSRVDPYFNEKKLSEARIASQMARKLNAAGIFIGILGNFSLILAIYYITISAL